MKPVVPTALARAQALFSDVSELFSAHLDVAAELERRPVVEADVTSLVDPASDTSTGTGTVTGTTFVAYASETLQSAARAALRDANASIHLHRQRVAEHLQRRATPSPNGQAASSPVEVVDVEAREIDPPINGSSP